MKCCQKFFFAKNRIVARPDQDEDYFMNSKACKTLGCLRVKHFFKFMKCFHN